MLSEKYKFVILNSALDLNGGSPLYSDSVNISGFHRATLVFQMGTLGGATNVLTICSGATLAAATTALTFNYAWTTATAAGTDADVLLSWTSAATVSLTHTTQSGFALICEVNFAGLTATHKYLTCVFTDPGGSTGLVNAHGWFLPRYKKGQSPTALV